MSLSISLNTSPFWLSFSTSYDTVTNIRYDLFSFSLDIKIMPFWRSAWTAWVLFGRPVTKLVLVSLKICRYFFLQVLFYFRDAGTFSLLLQFWIVNMNIQSHTINNTFGQLNLTNQSETSLERNGTCSRETTTIHHQIMISPKSTYELRMAVYKHIGSQLPRVLF